MVVGSRGFLSQNTNCNKGLRLSCETNINLCMPWCIMAQIALLSIAVSTSALIPVVHEMSGLSLPLLFSALAFLLVWIQEAWIIQYHYRSENIAFSRRFIAKYSNSPLSVIRYLHIFLAGLLVILIIIRLGYVPGFEGMLILCFVFLCLVRLFDPILGCLAQPKSIPWSSLVGYFVVFTFAVSSTLNPERLDFYGLPIEFSQGVLFGLVSYTLLNLRMAYYEKFCFLHEQSLESQLRLVLIPLLILSIHQVFSIIEAADLSAIFSR